MPEETEVEEITENVQKEASTETVKSEAHMIPKTRFDEINQKYKDAEKRYRALEKAAQEAEEKRLKEAEDYKALYEQAQARIAELQPKAESAETAHATLKEVLAAQIETIPENRRSLVPEALSTEQQLAWIAKNRSLLAKAQPFNIGAGAKGGSGENVVDLSNEDLAIAKKIGMSTEDYAKYKD